MLDPPLSGLVARLPQGWSEAEYDGRRWGLTRVDRVGGRVVTVYAEELGGRGVVSANVYRGDDQDLLRPCEMPADSVLSFLQKWRPA